MLSQKSKGKGEKGQRESREKRKREWESQSKGCKKGNSTCPELYM